MGTDYSRLVLIPAMGELSTRRNWCVWKLVNRGGKETKIPFVAGEDRALDTTEPEDWRDFKSAVDAAPDYSGIGFVFSKADPYVGVDFDKCVTDGVIQPWAAEWIKKLNSYTEFSPSGNGVHILCKGKIPEGRRKKGHIEVYDRERYFTVTGNPVPNTLNTLRDATEVLAALVKSLEGEPSATKRTTPKLEPLIKEIESVVTADARANPQMLAVLEENSETFQRTWRRSIKKDHWSDSEWDLSIANYLLAAGWSNPETVRALIEYRRMHGVAEKLRPDYYARTIIKASQHAESLGAEERITDPSLDDLPPDEKRKEVFAAINVSLWPTGGIEITDFAIHEADPPTFKLTTNKNDVVLTKEALLSGPGFHREVSVATRKLPRRLKPPAHDRMVDRLFEIARTLDIGEEATDEGRTKQYVGDYLRDRSLHMPKNGEFKEDALIEGVPVLWQGDICIQTKDFEDWLRRTRGVKMGLRQICGLLSESGFRHDKITYNKDGKSSSRSVWRVSKHE